MQTSSRLMLMTFATIAFGVPAGAQEQKEIYFHEDYNAALREAKLTQKPIFLEFRCAP